MSKGKIRDQQLAQIISEELDLIVSSAEDPKLADLYITRVDHAPGAAHFIVCFAPQEESQSFNSKEEIKQVLDRAEKYLRTEVAFAINLKRCPQLTFIPDPLYTLSRWGK